MRTWVKQGLMVTVPGFKSNPMPDVTKPQSMRENVNQIKRFRGLRMSGKRRLLGPCRAARGSYLTIVDEQYPRW